MKQKPIPSQPVPGATRATPRHQDIATQAYVLWNHYGQPAGRDMSIWLEAERQVREDDAQVSRQAAGAVDAKTLRPAVALDPLHTALPPEVKHVLHAPPR